MEILPKYLIADRNATYDVTLKALTAGKTEIQALYYCLEYVVQTERTQNDKQYSSRKFSDSYIRVSVFHNNAIEVITFITGWVYLIMWSTANCPQIRANYKRKRYKPKNLQLLHSE